MKPSKRTIAYHEAGHAVVARALGVGLEGVAIGPILNGKKGGAITRCAAYLARKTGAAVPALLAALEKDIKVAFAGWLAQNRYRRAGIISSRDYLVDDSENATGMAAYYVLLQDGTVAPETTDGGPGFDLTDQQRRDLDLLWKRLHAETQTMVEERWPAIERTAAALLSHTFLSSDDVDELIEVGT